MSRRYAISTATVVMLVVLRLNIGWHFFHEGVRHYTDPYWTSEPTLRSATGPLAPFYHGYLPDFHGLEYWLHDAGASKASSAVQGFLDEIQKDWDDRRQQFAMHYGLDEPQRKQATGILRDYQGQVRSWGSANKDDLEAHVHQWQRQETSGQAPDASEVPFRQQRLAVATATLNAEAAAWRAELSDLQRGYENALSDLLSDAQCEMDPLPRRPTSIDLVDTVMTYAILVIGALLLLGLLTRTACIAGALFLLSVVSMQPFWVSDAIPTYNQFVEMFALLMLSTTHVGRWGGLDLFVHNLIFGRDDATKGKIDAPES